MPCITVQQDRLQQRAYRRSTAARSLPGRAAQGRNASAAAAMADRVSAPPQRATLAMGWPVAGLTTCRAGAFEAAGQERGGGRRRCRSHRWVRAAPDLRAAQPPQRTSSSSLAPTQPPLMKARVCSAGGRHGRRLSLSRQRPAKRQRCERAAVATPRRRSSLVAGQTDFSAIRAHLEQLRVAQLSGQLGGARGQAARRAGACCGSSIGQRSSHGRRHCRDDEPPQQHGAGVPPTQSPRTLRCLLLRL